MKKICIKILTCVLLALVLISTASMYMPVNASTESAYENEFAFNGNGYVITKGFSGTRLDIKVVGIASNNNNEYVTIEVFINNRATTEYLHFYTDGQFHTFNNISLGSSGSPVRFTLYGANPDITISVHLETYSY